MSKQSSRSKYKKKLKKLSKESLSTHYDNMTPEIKRHVYVQLMIKQDGKCAICGKVEGKKKLCIDHCHIKGHIRGLLCNNCNTLLGFARDNNTILYLAMEYLNKNREFV